MKALAYSRVSTEEQAAHGVSLAAQAEKLRQFCALHDLELVEIVEDAGQSAKTLQRPGLQRALVALRRGDADGLVVAKLDRLTRSVRDLGELIDRFFSERAGRQLFSVADSVDTRSASGRLVLNLITTVSQWEREAIGERTRDALQHKRRAGRVYGHTPLGYDRDGDLLVENDDELATVAEVRRLHADGLSLRKICARMTTAGAKTKKGGAWRPSTVQAIVGRAA